MFLEQQSDLEPTRPVHESITSSPQVKAMTPADALHLEAYNNMSRGMDAVMGSWRNKCLGLKSHVAEASRLIP